LIVAVRARSTTLFSYGFVRLLRRILPDATAMPPAEALTMSSTSSDLLTMVRQHNHEAWGRFVALYAPQVYGWCRRAGVAAADAGDVTQEVFAKVFTAIADFRHDRPGDTLRGWLRVICRNKLHDHYRAGRRTLGRRRDRRQGVPRRDRGRRARRIDDYHRAAGVGSAGRGVGETGVRACTWQAFWLVAVERRTAVEAAEQLGMTAGAVRQAKYMVLRRLREELTGEFD
jgi:RNA polymerase sigma-70 factor (ECF subfamily)